MRLKNSLILKEQNHTTKVKTISSEKAIRDLNHNPKVSPTEGIERTADWMKWYYRINNHG